MTMTTAFANDLLEHILQNTALANVGNAAGLQPSGAAGSMFVALHTVLPTAGDATQTENEAAYTSYTRVGVARSAAGWAVASNVGDNVAAITFPAATGGSETEVAVSLGFATSGAGAKHIFGALTSNLAVSSGITPEFAIGALDVTAT